MASQETNKNPPPSTDSLNQELENKPPMPPQPPLSDSEDTTLNPPDNENTTALLPLKKRHKEVAAGALIEDSDHKKAKLMVPATTSDVMRPETSREGSRPNDYEFYVTSQLLMGIRRFKITTGTDPIDKEECMEDIIELLDLKVTVKKAMKLVNNAKKAYEFAMSTGVFDVFGRGEQDFMIYNRAQRLWGDQSNCSELDEGDDKMYIFYDVYTDRSSQARPMEIVTENQRETKEEKGLNVTKNSSSTPPKSQPLKVDKVDTLVDGLIGNLEKDLPFLVQLAEGYIGSSDISSYMYPDCLPQPTLRSLKINDSGPNRAGLEPQVSSGNDLKDSTQNRDVKTESPYLLRLRRDVDTQMGLFKAIIGYQEMHGRSPLESLTSARSFLSEWIEVTDEPESVMAVIEDLRVEHERTSANLTGMDLGMLQPLEREAFILAQKVFGSHRTITLKAEAVAVSSESRGIDGSDTNPSASDDLVQVDKRVTHSEGSRHDQSPGTSDDVIHVNPTAMQSEDVNQINQNQGQSADTGKTRSTEEPREGPSKIELMEGLVAFINKTGINPLEQDDLSLIDGLISFCDWKIPFRKFCDKIGEIKMAYETMKTAGALGSSNASPEEKKTMNLAARVWGDKDGATSEANYQ